ncbi:hypothetical protein PENSPDRAFT_654348 [Peniophora sp. CONT]|nr:hypothetical protein PENSPDRAFT_654348 [Peniophora sp. CONT]
MSSAPPDAATSEYDRPPCLSPPSPNSFSVNACNNAHIILYQYTCPARTASRQATCPPHSCPSVPRLVTAVMRNFG